MKYKIFVELEIDEQVLDPDSTQYLLHIKSLQDHLNWNKEIHAGLCYSKIVSQKITMQLEEQKDEK